MRVVVCPGRFPTGGSGTYRWSADTLILHGRWRTDRRLYTGVMRGDTLHVRDSTNPQSSISRYLRVPAAAVERR